MLKHIKTFEDYNNNFDGEVVNEELLFFKSIKDIIAKIGGISEQSSDEDVKNLFFELFDKLSKQTNFSVNSWKTIKEYINRGKITKQTMLELLKEAKSDYDQNGETGYLTITKGSIVYKKSGAISTRSGFAGGIGGGS